MRILPLPASFSFGPCPFARTARIAAGLFLFMGGFGSPSLQAATAVTWTGGGGDSLFDTTGNWSGGVTPPNSAAGASFDFSTAAGGTPINNLGDSYNNFADIQFKAGSGSFTINPAATPDGGGTTYFTTNRFVALPGATITQNSSSNQIINATVLTLKQVVTVQGSGSGTLLLRSFRYSTNGVLQVNRNLQLGMTTASSGTGSIHISNDARLTIINNGSIAGVSAVKLQVPNASLAGTGTISAPVSGSGTVDPGEGVGLLTAPSVDLSSGMRFNFEFTLANTAPNWASLQNDVLRLSGATPFSTALGEANTLSLFLTDAAYQSLGSDGYLDGGFYTDARDPLAVLKDANILAYHQDPLGSVLYNGQNYSLVTAGRFTLETVADSHFSANGHRTRFVYAVPEPGTLGLGAVGAVILALGLRARRRRRE